MTKISKREIIAFILGVIITGGIGVVAYTYNAKYISYEPSDNTWNVSNVSDTIDDIKANSVIPYTYNNTVSYGDRVNGRKISLSFTKGTYLVVLNTNISWVSTSTRENASYEVYSIAEFVDKGKCTFIRGKAASIGGSAKIGSYYVNL